MGDLLHRKRTEMRVFNSRSCYSLPMIPWTTHLGSNIDSPICFSFSNRRTFGWRLGSAEHLRPPHLPRSERAARVPREAHTPDGRLDPELPNPHRRRRATRWLLPLRTRQRPRAAGTFCRSAPQQTQGSLARAAPCSPRPLFSSRQRGSHRLLSGGGGRGATPPRPRRARHGTARQARLCTAGTELHGAPTPPGAGEDRAPGARRSLRPPPPTAPSPPLFGSGTALGPRPPGQSTRPGPDGGRPSLVGPRPLSPPGDPRPFEAARVPAGGGARPTGGETRRDATTTRQPASPRPRPAPREPLVAKSPTPEARRAPSNAAAPPADVMETSASASLPPVAAAAAGGQWRGAPPPRAPCLPGPRLRLPH